MENSIAAMLNSSEDAEENEQQAEEQPADSQPEESPEGETPLEGEKTPEDSPKEENVPYHKNPRFKKLIEERNELREANKAFEERLAALESSKLQNKETPVSIPEWFAEAFGADPNLYAKYRNHSEAERRQMRDEIRDEIRAEQRRVSEESERWEKWVKSQLDSLEDDGLQFDRNELMKFASDYTVVGNDGNIDFRKAHELMSKVKGTDETKSKERKKLGALGTPKGESPEKPEVFTSESIRKTGWGQI